MNLNEAALAVSNSIVASILVKATVTTALALVGARFARRSRAAVRHVLLAAAFAGLLVLPIVAIVAPSIPVAVPIAAAPVDAPTVEEPAIGSGASITPVNPATERPAEAAASAALSTSTLLVAAWAAGVALCLSPIVVGLWQMRALRRSGLPWRQRGSALESLAREASINRRVELLLHEGVAGPLTCGLMRPAIVLPMDAESWSAEDLTRAIVHELEHVRRGDWISQCAARAICAVYWFHPLVWVAGRQLALEAERACDDAVLRHPSTELGAGADAAAYADQLVGLAARLSTSAHRPLLAMANRHDLATRVVAVLDGRQRRGRAGAFSVALIGVAAALVLMTMSPLRLVAGAQAAPTSSATAPARFDAASIKPCAPEDSPPGTGGPRGTAGGTNASISPGHFTVPCVTLEQLIYLAYASYGASADQLLANDYLGTASDASKVRGGPAWVHSTRDKYAIEATAPGGVSDRTVLMGAMLRTLLEERFHLKVHRESEDAPMYALRVGKGGLKLKPMKDSDCDPNAGATPPPWTTQPCGFMTNGRTGPNSHWHYVGFQLGFLARQLAGPLAHHVIDETGVSGKFVIDLQFLTDDSAAPSAAGEPAAPSIFTAVEEQLGLKLEKVTGPRGYLVIDHAERPSPDSPGVARWFDQIGAARPARAAGAGGRR